ncbi:RxLR effector protein [Phytophthora megakarya]|uniref:RxLR effector protein n=1 Tax=Phytophthora megakarya TaxID=4795 RepID=A0A225WTI0_9STRA|nr:RxLR effector protein [Phytophthora megakarya]
MHLLMWVLMWSLVIGLSYCESASPTTNKSLRKALLTNLVPRSLVVNSIVNDNEIFLRGTNSKFLGVNDDEERAAGQNFLKRIKEKYLKWEKKKLIPRFEELANHGNTVTNVRNDFHEGMMRTVWFGTPSGYKRFVNLYEAYVKKNHPKLAK